MTTYNFASWKKTEPEIIKTYDTSNPPEYKLHIQYPLGTRILIYKPHTSELFDENGILFNLLIIFLGDKYLGYSELKDILIHKKFFKKKSNHEVKGEAKSFANFFVKGFNFIKENLWFLKSG